MTVVQNTDAQGERMTTNSYVRESMIIKQQQTEGE